MLETGKTNRLSKVAKEFNVGLHTIVESLAAKGFVVEANPNTKIDENLYRVLLEEFRSEKKEKEQSNLITIQQKESRQTVSIEESKQEKEEETEPTFIKEENPITENEVSEEDD